jgi:hypothetical protein
MDMHLLLTSLEAIKRICTHEKAKLESSKKTSHKGKKGKKRPGTKSTARIPKKVLFEKNCNLCKKHGGAYTTQTLMIVIGLRKTERRSPISAPLRKAVRKQILLTKILGS